jgi:hypothetical protein
MKTAREVALECLGVSPDGSRPAVPSVAAATRAIEARDRELVEACAKAVIDLPVVGIATAPYIAALDAAIRAVRGLLPAKDPT